MASMLRKGGFGKRVFLVKNAKNWFLGDRISRFY
jgi:hypothetical protein